MSGFLNNLFTTQFIPRGHCYLWQPELVWLHLVSDSLIALAYYSIPVMLVYLVHKRRDMPFERMLLMFGAFIVACGTTHVAEIWTLWHPVYWLSGSIKMITAIISLYTAIELVPLIPKILALSSPVQLEAANLALEHEITERKRVESALEKEQEFLRVLFDNLEAGIVACDAQGVLTIFNQATRKFHGLPEKPLPASEWVQHYNLYLPDGKTCMKKEDVPLFRALQEERVFNVEMMIVPKQGTPRTLLASGQALFDAQKKKLGAVVVMHDITKRQQAEEALRKSEAKNRALLNAIPDLILCVSKDGTYLDCKPPKNFEMLVSSSNLIGKNEYEVLPPTVAVQRMHYVEQALSTGEPQIFEYQLPINSDIRHEEARIVVSGDSEVLIIVRDITERKQAESHIQALNAQLEQRVAKRTAALRRANEELASEIVERKQVEKSLRQSEERLRLGLEVARMSSWDWNILTNQVTWGHNYEMLFGLTPGTFAETYEALLQHVHPEDSQLVAEALTCCVEQKACYDHEFRVILPDGNIRWLAGKGQVFYDETDNNKVLRMIGVTVDVTVRKRAEEKIKASLKEKEVLLKEIYHRVKNNLQIISSLLNLQSTYIEDEKALEILKAGENRVASMGLIHEQLYQAEDLAQIDFAKYIEDLAANLFSSYNISTEAIALKINVDNVHLDIDAAIPCGLIINELISNSLKYAFPLGKRGEICLDFQKDHNNNFVLTVSDNGIGLPKNIDFKNTASLGLQIVTALTNQLEGSIELTKENGTEFKIIF